MLNTAQIALLASSKKVCLSTESSNSGLLIYNRVHRRVITRDFSKALIKALCLAVLLTGFIRAIKGKYLIIDIKGIANFILGHKSLLDTIILYYNTSIGNIMLI